MKFVAIILVSLNILLTAIPCDDVNSFDLNQTELNAGHSENDLKDILDFCTPFCSCNCCSTIVINPSIDQYSSNIETFYSEFNSDNITLFSENQLQQVFQPPQV
tara:strand:- start:6682 stop:6993 length:312 start_codon:yes stop_codon:yes gene_type:complete